MFRKAEIGKYQTKYFNPDISPSKYSKIQQIYAILPLVQNAATVLFNIFVMYLFRIFLDLQNVQNTFRLKKKLTFSTNYVLLL
jgi:hypothetical protein